MNMNLDLEYGDPESRLWVADAGRGSFAFCASGGCRREAGYAVQVTSLPERLVQTKNTRSIHVTREKRLEARTAPGVTAALRWRDRCLIPHSC